MPAYAGTTRAISARIASASAQPNSLGAFWVHPPRDLAEDVELGPRFADARAGHFGAERDSPFGRRRRAAAALFVARRRGQQQHSLARLDEHLMGHDDVLVDAERRARECGSGHIGGGQHVEEVAAARPEHVEITAARGLHHRRGIEAGRRGHRKPPLPGERIGVVGSDRQPTRKRGGVAAHLGAALHARVPADRHEAGAGRGRRCRARGRG